MKYSLINVRKAHRGLVSGNWVQDYVGTLAGARARATAIEAVNGNKIKIAVVDQLSTPVPMLGFHANLVEL